MESSLFDEIDRVLEEALKQREQEKELMRKITEQKENVQKLERAVQSRWEKYLLSQGTELDAEIKQQDKELKMLRKNMVREQRSEEEEKRQQEQKREEKDKNRERTEVRRRAEEREGKGKRERTKERGRTAERERTEKKDETEGKHRESWDEDIQQKENLVQVLITFDSKTPKVMVKECVQTRGIMAGLECTAELPGEAAHEQDRENEEGPIIVVNIIPSTKQLSKACQCPGDSTLTKKEKKEWRKLQKRENKELKKQKKKEEEKKKEGKKKTAKEKTTERKSFWRKCLCC